MLTLHSFLQSVFLFVKSLAVKVKKEQYRTSSVMMAGAVVIAVVAFGASGFGGSGKNALAAPRIQESTEESEEPEEEVISGGSSFVTEAKIQFGLLNTDSEASIWPARFWNRMSGRNREKRQRPRHRSKPCRNRF